MHADGCSCVRPAAEGRCWGEAGAWGCQWQKTGDVYGSEGIVCANGCDTGRVGDSTRWQHEGAGSVMDIEGLVPHDV